MKKLAVAVFIVLPVFALAQGQITYTPLEPLPGVDQSGTVDFAAFLRGFFTLLLSVGGVIAVGALVLGGITYMTSEVVGKKDEARKRIQKAVWGLLLLIASYLILNTINPQLLQFNFFPQKITGEQRPAGAGPQPSVQSAGTPTQADVSDCQDADRRLITQPGGWRCG